MSSKRELRKRRHKRVRSKVKGTKNCPRLSVFRSLAHIYAQIIDDEKGKTIVMASDLELKDKKPATTKALKKTEALKQFSVSDKFSGSVVARKTWLAREVGKLIARKALGKKITSVVFDRGGYKYHGRVKAVADGAREGGLKF